MIDITTRRTIRKYTAEDVPSDLVNELLKKAERTQTMGNLQLYSVVATRDAANKARLAPLHFNQPMVQNAPVVLTFCADFHRTTEWAQRRKGHPGYDNFLSSTRLLTRSSFAKRSAIWLRRQVWACAIWARLCTMRAGS